MSYRPYFRSSIEELETLVGNVTGDLKTLKVVQFELRHRDRPRAKALKQEVDTEIARLSDATSGEVSPPYTHMGSAPPSSSYSQMPEGYGVERVPSKTPSRLVVECPQCGTKNFVSALEGTTQHMSCSSCKTPFEARFAYGTLRTVFQPKPAEKTNRWPALALTLLTVLFLFVVIRELF